MRGRERYQLRKAAGLYWLLDMDQGGAGRQDPVALNDSGAYIWEQFNDLGSEEAVAEKLSAEFGISVEEGLEDIGQFFRQLEKQGIII